MVQAQDEQGELVGMSGQTERVVAGGAGGGAGGLGEVDGASGGGRKVQEKGQGTMEGNGTGCSEEWWEGMERDKVYDRG